MQRAGLLLVIVALIVGLIWWQRPVEKHLEEMVPADLVGLVLVKRFPDSLEFVSQTRLGEWFGDDSVLLRDRLAGVIGGEWLSVMKANLESACIVLHRLEKKKSGAFRPHLTAYLRPGPGRNRAIEEWIQKTVSKRFGEDRTRIVQEGTIRVFRGEVAGEILHLGYEQDYLIVSNSESGWKDVQLTLAGRATPLGERQSFKDIQTRINDADLFFYFRGAENYGLLPEFGYGVRVDKEQVTDIYWEVPKGDIKFKD